ncbi:hypothetical protein [uncultured Psychroserpens sp.]|uniref:hypothetical protein n=1 Tax=uncultured Psychroserpens sp. TaxID=255436 RepID=UPI00261DE1ED|nr:hypothetical protein [uncultured Psychroserpens sp.]
MGGYMGFGMASWIYKQRPNRAFSIKKGKPTCNTIPSYSRQFKMQPSKPKSNFYIVMSLLFLGLLFSVFYFKAPVLLEHSNTIRAQKQAYIQNANDEAFKFLISSGIQRLKRNNLTGAYSEFKLAYAIYPKNEKLQQLLIETLSALCEDANTYCADLDKMLNQSL